MAYERDSDRLVRGVGAIAARDAGNGRRHQLRLAQARATRRRDQALSGVTFGPRGGMRGPLDLGLGYTPTIVNEGRGAGSKGSSGGVIATFTGATGSSKLYGGSGGTPTTTLGTGGGGTLATFNGQTGTTATFNGGTTGGSTIVLEPPPSKGSGSKGGGGGGGGGGSGIKLEPPLMLPPVPSLPPFETAGGAPDNTTRNLVIAGGIALAAWLYFRNRGGG